MTWFPLDNPEDIRARDISGDAETEGLGRTVRSVIEGLRYTVVARYDDEVIGGGFMLGWDSL